VEQQRSKWMRERPWVRADGVTVEVVGDRRDEVVEKDEVRVDSTLTEREAEEFAWLNRVYRGARSNTWWSNLFVFSVIGVFLMLVLGLGRMRGDGLLAVLFIASMFSMVLSLFAVYFSYELFLSREPDDLTDFSKDHWQSLTRTALYFPIYLIIFSLFCTAIGMGDVLTGMNLAYRLNGIVLTLGLYQRMTTLSVYLKNDALRRRVGYLNAPFWVLMVLLAVRLMVENGLVPIMKDRGLRIAYIMSMTTAAIFMYVNYYFVMRQFRIAIRQRLLEEADRYQVLRETYEADIEGLEEDEEEETLDADGDVDRMRHAPVSG
jgi:hypothetical protein